MPLSDIENQQLLRLYTRVDKSGKDMVAQRLEVFHATQATIGSLPDIYDEESWTKRADAYEKLGEAHRRMAESIDEYTAAMREMVAFKDTHKEE